MAILILNAVTLTTKMASVAVSAVIFTAQIPALDS
jgi:hypothetical protein